MKYINILALYFLLFSIPIYATENKQTTPAITQLIQKIKHSSPQNRRLLINQLKVALREMNQETRKKVMKDLQKSFASQKSTQSTPKTSKVSGNAISALQSSQQSSSAIPMRQRQVSPASVPILPRPMRPTSPGNGQPRGPR